MQIDPEQQRVVEAEGGHWLVLAPPGCGKTEMLARRVAYAMRRGVAPGDMLCLTFTNRASRGMGQRIRSILADDATTAAATAVAPDADDGLFVGNIHRYCSRLLLDEESALTHPDAGIVDEVDYADILDQLGLTKDATTWSLGKGDDNPYGLPDAPTEVNRLQHYLQQLSLGQPESVWLRDCGHALQAYLSLFGIAYAPERSAECLIQLMAHAGGADYAECKERLIAELKDWDSRRRAAPTEAAGTPHVERWHMLYTCILSAAMSYARYKAEHHLIDFDDILVLAYDAIRHSDADGDTPASRRFKWIQVDEVQDLNALQLAIVDSLTADDATVVYLGDEQQAIFSFMGAKVEGLRTLAQRCEGHVVRLRRNHRSPSYLLDMLNHYAIHELNIPPDILPSAAIDGEAGHGDMVVRDYKYYSRTTSQGNPYAPAATAPAELEAIPAAVNYYMGRDDGDTVAVVVPTNHDADDVACQLRQAGIPHFRISGQDVFRQMDFKTLLAHLLVGACETNYTEWARLMYRCRATPSFTDARRLARRMQSVALTPADLMAGDSSYVEQWLATTEGEYVIFDTETTGLDVEHDDIVQIAAITVRDGAIVPGSEFDIIMPTDREIPPTLGDIDNPLVEEYARRAKTPRAEGLRRFLDYVGTKPVLGHNARFDYEILRHNIRRTLPDIRLEAVIPTYWDSLRLARLLEPELKAYKLKSLLARLDLAGENSHLASDDIVATLSLANYCRAKAADVTARQHALRAMPEVTRATQRLRQVYRPVWDDTRQAAPSDTLRHTHDALVTAKMIDPIDRIDYICRYAERYTTVDEALADLRTLSEADLCEAGVVDDRVYVLTVHKAKGLEFDSVIVFDAVDGKYPWYRAATADERREDARKLYVAMSRARRRLCVMSARCWVWEGDTRAGHWVNPIARRPSPFLDSVAQFFGAQARASR